MIGVHADPEPHPHHLGQQIQQVHGRHDPHALDRSQAQQIVVAADEKVGTRGQRAGDDVIVVRVA